MDTEIERLVYQMRKEVYRDLEKGKEIVPRGWFFVSGKSGAVEIMIPGIEPFFENGEAKDRLTAYVAYKWGQYQGKGNYDLLAVVIMSDQWVTVRSTDGMSREEIEKLARNVPPPRTDKNRKEFITFMVFMADVKKAHMFRYVRENRRVKWMHDEDMEDIELADMGRFRNMYPKHLQKASHG